MSLSVTSAEARAQIEAKLSHFYGVMPQEATDEQYYKAVSMIVREMLHEKSRDFKAQALREGKKKVYYLSMEFLMGRSLKNNLFNLDLTETFENALGEMGIKLSRLYEQEPDAGLGNGGLGRLAACYLDALASQGYQGMGYSILYEYGIFKQKLVDGWQTELPDFWLPGGEVWLLRREQEKAEVRFGGSIEESWDNAYHTVEHRDCTSITAVPYDMFVSGKGSDAVSILRLWKAEAPGLDMSLFDRGQYMRAMERTAMAEVISKVLYPADNHPEGKSLRLKQQYFLVSASVQDIVHRHLRHYGTLDSFAEKNAVHINDTHPTLSIPELMRIMLDECGYGWDEAWSIVTKTVAYTNHTVMKEALECWSEDLFRTLLPRIYTITKEIDNRYRAEIWEKTHDADRVERMAVISNGAVRMANLCVASCHSVNGVSGLHSQILKDDLFREYYELTPEKFTNVTNGIAHRRWLCQANPLLTAYLKELIGDGFILNAQELSKLREYSEDKRVLKRLGEIKHENKVNFAKYVYKKTGIELNPDSIFDVQVKRLHEYKRQHLNALNIVAKYLEIKENPTGDFVPHTYIFGAKSASGYFMAKKIISFIYALSKLINSDSDVKSKLKVVYLEDYNVTMAERLMPSADISEQISLAGTEASGTGNMKLMINGAVTLGTLDGANVEIRNQAGEENMILFGMRTNEVNELKKSGYNPESYYRNNPELKKVIDFIMNGIDGKQFPEIAGTIIHHDPYMVLADFADYRLAQKKAEEIYRDREKFNRMSLLNVAGAGVFASDRAINEYAENIWNL